MGYIKKSFYLSFFPYHLFEYYTVEISLFFVFIKRSYILSKLLVPIYHTYLVYKILIL